MSKRIAVVLSGCGVYDGSEIYETVITLLRLDERDTQVQCFAPDIAQMHVINHAKGEPADAESRNVLVEAARLARGEIKNLKDAKVEDFDALIVPGGFGAAKNLSNFAVAGPELSVQTDFLRFAQGMHQAGKPIGLECIAPVMSAKICGEGVSCTIGKDVDTATAVESTGAVHEACDVESICVDTERKLVTTPAYMLAGRIRDAATGITQLVDAVLEMA